MRNCVSGGMPLVRPGPLSVYRKTPEVVYLLSDLHIGAANVDYTMIRWELEDAASDPDNRILLGGDLFDLILPSDKKRFTPETLHPRLQGRSDILNVALDWGEEILSPYVDQIDGIGIGNHEQEALRRHYLDLVTELVRRLNDKRDESLKPIAQLGWTAYIQYEVKLADGGKLAPYTIWYHHGIGKTSECHRGLRTLHERGKAFDADLYWSGHYHALGQTVERRVVLHKGRAVHKDVRHVLTGSYMIGYGQQSQEDMKRNGRKSNYVAERGCLPHGLGGARVELTWEGSSIYPRVSVKQ